MAQVLMRIWGSEPPQAISTNKVAIFFKRSPYCVMEKPAISAYIETRLLSDPSSSINDFYYYLTVLLGYTIL